MNPAIRILHMDIDPATEPLLVAELLRSDVNSVLRRVATFGDFTAALDATEWDVVLCGDLPKGIERRALLRHLSEYGRDLPFIVLASDADEDSVVEAVKAGAHDYITRGNLLRLAPSVVRGMHEAQQRRQRSKNQFFSLLSHELRTPMTVFMGMVELVLDTDLTLEQRDYLTTAMSSADQLLCLITDLLDFAQMEQGETRFVSAPLNLHRCLERAVQHHAAAARQKGLSLSLEIAQTLPEIVLGDAVRLQQALEKLIDNAVKFTERGSVTVSASAEADTVRLCVRDTGIGLCAEQKSFIFQQFTQVEDTNVRRFGGMGLGLALTRRIAEGMGGRVEVSSRLGSGSEFRLLLPLKRPAVDPCVSELREVYQLSKLPPHQSSIA